MMATLDHLTPDTREAVLGWLDAMTLDVEPALAASLREDLLAAVLDQLDEDASPQDVAVIAAAIGPLDLAGSEAEPTWADPRVGTFAGIPYDWRPPTAERLRRSLWDPTDPRLWRARAFGAGWDLNLGALCVRLGLIEPDAEDDPFTSTPNSAFVVAAGLPVGLAVAVVLHYAVRGRTLPTQLPTHWNLHGEPDRWTTRRRAACLDVSLAVLAAVVAAGAARGRGDRPARAALLAAASAVATGQAGTTVWRAAEAKNRPWAGPLLAVGVAKAATVTLLWLAIAGRNAERARDLGARS